MAWAERLPSGKWRGCWRDPSEKKCYTRRPEFPEHPYGRKRDAIEAAQEAEVAARRKVAASKGVISASTQWGEWWEQTAAFRSDTDTEINERSIAKNYLIPKWGEVELNQIEQQAIKAWIADLLAKREPSYVRRIYAVFRHSLNVAVEKGVLTGTPCVGIKITKVRRKQKTYVDEEFVAAISPHLPQHYRNIIDLGMETGLRPSELGGLHADMVDLDDGWLVVSKVLVPRARLIRPFPKDDDERSVPLTDEAVRIIQRCLGGRDLKAGCGLRHTAGKGCLSPLVFVNKAGDPILPQAWYVAMQRAAAAAKVPVRGPYAVRRGFATRAARGGMDAFELAEIMGHADVRQTQEYVQRTQAARARLSAALGGAPRMTIVRDAG